MGGKSEPAQFFFTPVPLLFLPHTCSLVPAAKFGRKGKKKIEMEVTNEPRGVTLQ